MNNTIVSGWLLRRSGPLVLAPALLAVMLVAASIWFVGSASAAVPGLQLVTKTGGQSSFSKQAFAICPTAKRTLGGGGLIIGGQGQVALDDIFPESGTAFTAGSLEDEDGFAGSWFVQARAICANPVPGLQIISATSSVDSNDKGASANCPSGKRVLGAGAEIRAGGAGVTLDDVVPRDTFVSVFVREIGAGTTGKWSVSAYAICSNPLAGLELTSAASPSDSFSSKSVAALCSPGKKLLGGGGEITGGLGEVVLRGIHPNGANLASMVVSAEEAQGGSTRNWQVDAYAICATP